jgi:enolase
MAKIAKIWAREILDSRGTPTIEAACQLDTGQVAVAAVPSGTSTGTYEALELRDADPNRYFGKGVLNAVNNINQILGPALIGQDPINQYEIDAQLINLDGTQNKQKMGANAILAVSQVVTKAGAMASQVTLYKWVMALAQKQGIKVQLKIPTPVIVIIEGGLHGSGNLDFQEFWIIPATSKPFYQSLQMAAEIYHTLGENLAHRNAIHSVGEEGAYAPNLFTNADALEVIVDTIRSTNYQLGRDVFLGLDVAASTFFKGDGYSIRDKSFSMTEEAMIEYYKVLNQTYHMALLEDPLHEDAWDGWKKVTSELGGQLPIVGDDFLVTNPSRVAKAISEKACNAILVKPNQVGTISETLDVIKKSRDAGWKIIVSHRGGETNDSFIADFAVGVGADYVKFGSTARGERVAKYNRLSSIEVELRV